MAGLVMRLSPYLLLALAAVPACALVAKSPALNSPLQERLAKADSSRIEEGARACLTEEGWTPDDVTADAEGANVVSAKNSAKARQSIYIQPRGSSPRVTGDPPYDDPFWKCLSRDLGRGAQAAAAASASAAPAEDHP
jgi:hypothetical protein